MSNTILDRIFSKDAGLKVVTERFQRCLGSDLAEGFLQLLLTLMSAVFMVSRDFKRSIKDFSGRYVFRSRDNRIETSVLFENGRMHVREGKVDNPNVTVVFKDSKALMSYLLSPKPDILGSLLRQDVVIDGNFNYLYKFAYMANRLKLMVTGGA
jgi:hypothetical protein